MRDWKWDHKVEQHITVSGILNLNLHPEAKHQGTQRHGTAAKCLPLLCAGISRDHKRLCCLCCKSGPISAAIHTDRAVS